MNDHHDHATGRACAACGTSLEGKRSDAIYCSTRCRNRVSEHRRYHADLEKSRARERAKSKLRTARRRAAKAQPKPNGWLQLLVSAVALVTGQPSAAK